MRCEVIDAYQIISANAVEQEPSSTSPTLEKRMCITLYPESEREGEMEVATADSDSDSDQEGVCPKCWSVPGPNRSLCRQTEKFFFATKGGTSVGLRRHSDSKRRH